MAISATARSCAALSPACEPMRFAGTCSTYSPPAISQEKRTAFPADHPENFKCKYQAQIMMAHEQHRSPVAKRARGRSTIFLDIRSTP